MFVTPPQGHHFRLLWGGGGEAHPTAGVPIPEGNWYLVVVEVVYVIPGSIPERVQYANMDDWRMDVSGGLYCCFILWKLDRIS